MFHKNQLNNFFVSKLFSKDVVLKWKPECINELEKESAFGIYSFILTILDLLFPKVI